MTAVSRLLPLALLGTVLFWLVLQYTALGESETFTEWLTTGLVALSTATVVHMFADRRLSIWTTSAVGILLGLIGYAVLFGWFDWQVRFGRLAPGIRAGWFNLAKAFVLAHLMLFGGSLIAFRWRRHVRGEETVPGELLLSPDVIPRRRADDWRTDE